MQARAIHRAAEELAGEPVSWSSVRINDAITLEPMASKATSTRPDPAAVLQLLHESEAKLLGQSEALDEPIARDEYRLAILALGQRAKTLFQGFMRCRTA
jgi:hypothetical protein